MSFLMDTDLLSLLERKQVPAKLASWVQAHETEIFLSVVSFAELQFGLNQAPLSHKPALSVWLQQTRRAFAGATEQLTEPVLVRWKQLLSELKGRNRTITCEDSLIAATALFHGHVVATHNKRHFEPAGVQVFDPLTH
jgi:predicted nucleic acid-binding protein